MRNKIRILTFISILSALAVVGRIYLTFIPNFQPVTAIIIICSMFLGIRNALMLAVVSTVVSNLVLGMGIWTLWQVLAWGTIAIVFGLLGKFNIPVIINAILAGVSGLLYGVFMSMPYYLMSGNFWVYYIAGFPFDMNHAIGNIVFFVVLYPIFKRIFERSKLAHA